MGNATTIFLGLFFGVAFHAVAWMLAFASHSFFKEQKALQWFGCMILSAFLQFGSWASILLAYKSATQ